MKWVTPRPTPFRGLPPASALAEPPALDVGALSLDEGTLAVITAARLRLRPVEPHAATVLAGLDGIEAAVAAQAEIRARVLGVRAAEYFEAAGLELVLAHTGLSAPLPRAYPSYLLAEVGGT